MTQTATSLAASVTAATEHLTLAAPLSDDEVDGFYVQIGTELMEVLYRGTKTNPGVRRGRLGTSPATHSATNDVTPVKVVVQTDAPTAPPPATAGGVVPVFYRQADDPGAVGAGNLWLDTTQDAFDDLTNFPLFVRNGADDGWLPVIGDAIGDINLNAYKANGTVSSVIQLRTAATALAKLALFGDTGESSLALSDNAGLPVLIAKVGGVSHFEVRDSLGAANITIPGLPTSDPSTAGTLWNDAGTLKVSAG